MKNRTTKGKEKYAIWYKYHTRIDLIENFAVQATNISDLKVITPFFMEDDRGYFLKSVEKSVYKSFDLNAEIYEDFETFSKQGVIRGLHFQTKSPQAKIVRVIHGEIYDVAVDLRKGSTTYGKWESIYLSDKNRKIFYIPEGFAHGFLVTSSEALVSYKCIGEYLKEYDTGILWNDPMLANNWNISTPIISDKDNNLMSFHSFDKEYGGL